MSNLNYAISQLTINQISDFFELYKTIASESFEEWTTESKQHWFTVDYPESYWQELVEQGELPVFVAIKDSKLIGFAAVEGINFGVVYLGWIGVQKDSQRQGIGDALMHHIIKWAESQPVIHKIELETQISGLQPYYEKHGFVLEGIRKNSWQKLDNYMYGKDLA